MWDKQGLVFLTQIFWLWFQMHSQQHPPTLKNLRSDRWTAPARDAPVVLSGWRVCHLGVSDACHLGSVAGWDLGGASPWGERDSVMRCHCVPKPSINGAHVVFMSVKQSSASLQGRRVRLAPLFDRAGDELQSPLSACLVWWWLLHCYHKRQYQLLCWCATDNRTASCRRGQAHLKTSTHCHCET